MKHLACIQTQFAKIALDWDKWKAKQQRQYLSQHPLSRRHVTGKGQYAPFDSVEESTKEKYLSQMDSWVKHEDKHKKLAITMKNFMHQYLPDKFYRRVYDGDFSPVPENLFEDLRKKYGNIPVYLEQQSGDEVEDKSMIVDEKSEKVVPVRAGGEYFSYKIATGLVKNRRVIIVQSERAGLAPVTDKDGKEKHKVPYDSCHVDVIVGV